jgi:hypothetical protein
LGNQCYHLDKDTVTVTMGHGSNPPVG